MKIVNLTTRSNVYSCNVYLVTGNFNALDDVNTLVDTGHDIRIIERIKEAATGVGKKRIEQVILTHSHYDHAGMVKEVKKNFSPRFYAFTDSLEDIDINLKGGEKLQIGDRIFDVLYTPGHSNDSICLYNDEEKVLFSGDTNLIISSTDGSYEQNYVDVLKNIAELDIAAIYPGHGIPILKECNRLIRTSYLNILHSKIL